ncbi:Rubredoxin-like domain [Sesbania bispinosa]|nr:Rubredoxin-like domain [Sesbania bispinosa]
MAYATPRPALPFHLSTPFSQFHSLKPKLHFTNPSLLHKTLSTTKRKRSNPRKFTVNSVDISKEDTPPTTSSESEQPDLESQDQNLDKLRLEEKFAVLNTGIYECRSCGYKYDEAVGDPSYPIPPGYQYEKLPDDWRCPTCGAAKSFFESKSVEIAGFAQNQQYGLGGNSLTSGQKTVLIYGTLLFFFVLFLSGYFLQ